MGMAVHRPSPAMADRDRFAAAPDGGCRTITIV
jgi:hypothetical protein